MLLKRLVLAAAVVCALAAKAGGAALEYRDGQLATARHAMVVTQQPLATRAGLDVLRDGGNAIDAAVAAAFALAVVHPQAGNLGGGGFLLYYGAADSLCTFIDFRESAPARASRDMYLDAKGDVDTLRSQVGPWSSGVPGTPAGLYLAWSKYGRRPWRSLLAPAITHARSGFAINEDLASAIRDRRDALRRSPASAALFLPKGRPLAAGARLVQRDLARTLQRLRESGPLSFYEGAVAAQMVQAMARAGGPFTAADLAAYRAVERTPVRGRYRDLDVLAAPPPSSGGVTLLEILAILEHFDLSAAGPRSAPRVHTTVEAMARGFADRNTWLADPAFLRVPIAGLLAPAYILGLRQSIAANRATPADRLEPGNPWAHQPGAAEAFAPPAAYDSLRPPPVRARENDHTTHLSIVDAEGNIVSLTTTLNDDMGSGWMVPGAGFLLNNEMDDFVAKPGVPNMYGLVGGEANTIAPGKRPLSSMCPTIVLRGGRPWLVLGSKGGPRILTAVLTILTDRRDHGLTLQAAVAQPRFHHQWKPHWIQHEPDAFTDDVARALRAMGHELRERTHYGGAQCIEIAPDGTRQGVSDPRTHGAAMGY